MEKVTINEIAKRSGVSKATVSRVINNSKPVSDEVRQKVMAVIESTNFVPSALGRSLSLKKSHLIGVIIPDLANPVFSRIIAGMESYLRSKNYSLLITATDFNIDTGIRHIQILNEKAIDGLIFLAGAMNEELIQALNTFHKPVVVIGSDIDSDTIPVIEIDNKKAAYDATVYLVSIGHKNIAMIRGPLSDRYAGKERFIGYQEALMESGLYQTHLVVEGKYTFDHGYNAMKRLLVSKPLPTAVFCANDLMAIGAMKCAFDEGFKVPADISFIGFDDVEIAKMYNPTLTTIHQPFEEKGLQAIERLIDMIKLYNDKKEASFAELVILPHKLVVRQSTAKVNHQSKGVV
ncbi:MAG: Transcriptional regulator [Clostridiales bacterium 38_11]|nr:MAG: Transcriptional regulator [Clostridiales bacterium 38_11]HBH12629.1 catabolite control protein A [Clostridiales bacterium]